MTARSALFIAVILSFASAANAQPTDDLVRKEQILSRQYQDFEQQLLRLKQRLERSPQPADRDRAVVLNRVLERCKTQAISVRFEQLIDVLKSKELTNLPDVKEALSRSAGIVDELQIVIAMLREDPRDEALKHLILTARQLADKLDGILQDQKSLEALTNHGRTNRNELKDNQGSVADRTADFGKLLKDFADKAAGEPSAQPVADAHQQQQQAKNKIADGKNAEATGHQGVAIRKLEVTREQLRKLIQQLREEEIQRTLTNLRARLDKMLAMQTHVLAGTIEIHAANLAAAPAREGTLKAFRLAELEGDIVAEASKAITLLETDGTVVAFPEVFRQMRVDMKAAQSRLAVAHVDAMTQKIEHDVIDTLKEMLAAIDEKIKDVAEANPPPPGPTSARQDPKLLERAAELKMIRSWQARVNDRTRSVGQRFPGEQAIDPELRDVLRTLSDQQERIFEITRRLADRSRQD